MAGKQQQPANEIPTFDSFLTRSSEIEVVERNLPHWQFNGGLYFVTWRLADSVPAKMLRQWNEERRDWLIRHPRPWDAETLEAYRQAFPRRLEAWLDAGYGSCILARQVFANHVALAMHKFDGIRYDIASFVVMPNHVHALFQLRDGVEVRPVLKAWKGVSARRINQLRGTRGTLWQQEYRDTCIRSPKHLIRSFGYILENPAYANLSAGEFFYYELPGVRRQLRGWSGDFDDDQEQ